MNRNRRTATRTTATTEIHGYLCNLLSVNLLFVDQLSDVVVVHRLTKNRKERKSRKADSKDRTREERKKKKKKAVSYTHLTLPTSSTV